MLYSKPIYCLGGNPTLLLKKMKTLSHFEYKLPYIGLGLGVTKKEHSSTLWATGHAMML